MPSTTYYWDEIDDNVCCEEDENGEITASYTHEPGLYGEVIAQKRGDEVHYHNYDGEGNTCELTDEDENVTDTYEYSAFGEEVAKTGTTENPFGYKGALGYYSNGETNDLYVRARTYEPRIGRWLLRDPLGFVDCPNLYMYVKNAPVALSDPSGMLFQSNPFESPQITIPGFSPLLGPWGRSLLFPPSALNDCQIGYLFQQSIIFPPAATWPPAKLLSGNIEFQQWNFNLLVWLNKECQWMKPETLVVVDRLLVNTRTQSPTKASDVRALLSTPRLQEACAALQLTIAVVGFQNDPSLMFDPLGPGPNRINNPTIGKYAGLLSLSPLGGYIDFYFYLDPEKCECICDKLPCIEWLRIGGVSDHGSIAF